MAKLELIHDAGVKDGLDLRVRLNSRRREPGRDKSL